MMSKVAIRLTTKQLAKLVIGSGGGNALCELLEGASGGCRRFTRNGFCDVAAAGCELRPTERVGVREYLKLGSHDELDCSQHFSELPWSRCGEAGLASPPRGLAFGQEARHLYPT